MPSIAIFGDSGMGKTMIMQRFCAENPPGFDPEAGRERTPILALQMSGQPNERRLYSHILAALGAPQGPRSEISRLERSALSLLKAIGVQALVIDEIHNILAGTHREQRIVLNALRFLSNELKVSLICFGVTDAREAISGDVQLARRFDELTLRSIRSAYHLHLAEYATPRAHGPNSKIAAPSPTGDGRSDRPYFSNAQRTRP